MTFKISVLYSDFMCYRNVVHNIFYSTNSENRLIKYSHIVGGVKCGCLMQHDSIAESPCRSFLQYYSPALSWFSEAFLYTENRQTSILHHWIPHVLYITSFHFICILYSVKKESLHYDISKEKRKRNCTQVLHVVWVNQKRKKHLNIFVTSSRATVKK